MVLQLDLDYHVAMLEVLYSMNIIITVIMKSSKFKTGYILAFKSQSYMIYSYVPP